MAFLMIFPLNFTLQNSACQGSFRSQQFPNHLSFLFFASNASNELGGTRLYHCPEIPSFYTQLHRKSL